MSQHENNEGRRRFLKVAVGTMAAATVLGTLPGTAFAADLPHVAIDDPTAKALSYTEDASKTAKPKTLASDACSNCTFYKGQKGAAFGPCDLFPGKAVAAKGWCVSHNGAG